MVRILLDKVQDADERKARKNLEYMRRHLHHLRVGHVQFLLDLPLDYHDCGMTNEFKEACDLLESLIKGYWNC